MAVKCAKCEGKVSRNDSIRCSACESIFHASPNCSNTKQDDLDFLKNANKLNEWKCPKCITDRRKSLANFDSSILENLFQDEDDGKSKSSLTKNDLIAIGSVLREMIRDEISPNFKKEFGELKKSVEFISAEFDLFKTKLQNNEREITDLKKENLSLKKENSDLKSDISSLQSYSRRDNIMISGIPETQNEKISEIFNRVSKAINSNVLYNDVSVAHRVPVREKGRIKPIIVKFVKRQDKEQWMESFKKTSQQDHRPGISIKLISNAFPEGRIFANNHLTSNVSKLLKETKECAKNKGYNYVWVRDDIILVKKDENSTVIRVKTKEDIAKL